jgi:ABC-type multidrug transport system fused ATPase/permease subunit
MSAWASATALVGKFRFLLTPAERKSALVLLGLMALGMGLETLCTGLVVPVVALITQPDLAARYPPLAFALAWLGHPSHAGLIFGAMLTLVAVYAVKNLYLAFLAWRQARFSYGVQASVSHRLFAGYLRQPYAFHLQRNSAELISNTTRETAIFHDALFSALMVVTEVLVLAGISILLLVIEPLGALVTVLLLAAAAWSFHQVTRKRSARWGERRQVHEALRLQQLQQGLGGAKDVKLLGREEEFLAQFAGHNAQSVRVAQYQGTLQQLPRLWLEFLAVFGLVILVFTMLAQGKSAASIAPTLGLFAAAAFRLMPSVNRVVGGMQTLRYTAPAVYTLYEEMKLAPADPGRAPRPASAPSFQDEIALLGVTYTYPQAATPALSDVEVRVGKSESVGIIGTSGAGKSTLVDVLLGLLPPGAGQVKVDGADVQENPRAWQDQIGYVPQSVYLTDDSLRRNVAFGIADADIDDAAVMRAIRAAQLDGFVAELPQGLDSLIGERGVRLSGGQRQRIGIARALYHDPAVLVLDEATSALDTATERGVMQAVTALHGRKTIVIIAHRLSTVAGCDRLYRLEAGRVVAEGTHAEVLPT